MNILNKHKKIKEEKPSSDYTIQSSSIKVEFYNLDAFVQGMKEWKEKNWELSEVYFSYKKTFIATFEFKEYEN